MLEQINRYLDAAILKPETTRPEAIEAIEACIEMKTRTVCVRPCDIALAKEMCTGTETGVCVVLGFPHGVQLSRSKADEAARYVDAGVDEIDMVVNYGYARSGLWQEVKADIAAVSAVTRPAAVPLKVIIETAQIDSATIRALVDICVEAGADFVKTSTGFNGEGAQEDDIRMILEVAAGRVKVKPSGGIRDRRRAEMFIRMGAHRLGVNWTSCQAICSGVDSATEQESY